MRLLVADDETYTREGIINSLDWTELGVTEIMQAKDGREALQISAWFNPDIVITDIKMPKLNGIEFAEKLIGQCPYSKLMFMSGYVEIEYLKKAIDLSAVDYIEKPVSLDRIKTSVMKAVRQITERKRNIAGEMEKIELQRMNLANLLRYKDIDHSAVYKICGEVNFPIEAAYQTVVVWYKKQTLNRDEIIQTIQAFWNGRAVDCLQCYLEDNRYLIILAYKREDSKRIEYLIGEFGRLYENISIGVGFETGRLAAVYPSMEIALLNVEQAFYRSDSQVFNLNKDVLSKKNLNPHLFSEFNSLVKENPKCIKPWLSELFQNIRDIGCYSRRQILTLISSFVKLLLSVSGVMIFVTGNFGSEEDVENHIDSMTSLNELEEFINKLADLYIEISESKNQYSKPVTEVISYLELNYSNHELKVGDIAGHLHFSVSHLNMLFKNETGITIKQYIDDYRVELAKKMLLAHRHEKINDIAIKCGYSNLNYFSKVFKNTTGLRPIEYRKKKGRPE